MSSKCADIYWLGHKHVKVLLPNSPIITVSHNNQLIQKNRSGFITGSYLKNFSEYDALVEGYRINYGEERMRTLQESGGILMFHSISQDKSSKNMGRNLEQKFYL
jgi:hypothetical protein